MKKTLNLIARGVMIIFWLGVLAALFGLLPGKLHAVLPPFGMIVLLMHWAQVTMIRKGSMGHFEVTRQEFWQIIIFGVFAADSLRERLKEITNKPRG
jgi:putative membrane protein